jgi:hypothetical protein
MKTAMKESETFSRSRNNNCSYPNQTNFGELSLILETKDLLSLIRTSFQQCLCICQLRGWEHKIYDVGSLSVGGSCSGPAFH